ncbi:long chain fatty acyl diphosphate synthase [Cryptosporidium sp. chipmunk genotype I]|uniref:long chain fatty acyl diphosphate synthase n=1 Tax=Cryptosporidium sp. chipmunk genotype I TaxID=1280935 RepID=UPI003519E0CD|nr:long chain fatty acyl diphosphate synthase [Cryptosporidium sp. chipmunk genotype I]
MKDIVKYVFQSEGKLTRQHYLSALVGLLNSTMGIHSQTIGSDHRMLIHSIQLIHSASLLHDDILDNSEIKRGKKAPYKIFANKKAILLGDYLFSKSCLNISLIDNINAMKCISIIAENLVKGEFSQFNGLENLIESFKNSKDRKSLINEYFEKYLLKSYYKTASLFSFGGIACSELLKKSYGNKFHKEMIIYSYYMGLNFGLAFQLMDDILDFTNSITLRNSGKPFLNDIKQGILTIPIYFLLSMDPENATQILINSNFHNRDKAEILKDLVKMLFDTNSIQVSVVCVAQYLERYIHYINLISRFERNVFTSLLVKMAENLLEITDNI